MEHPAGRAWTPLPVGGERLMFTSRTAESYDPQPWVDDEGNRYTEAEVVRHNGLIKRTLGIARRDPRPEFEPTRDKFPWAFDGVRAPVRPSGDWRWAPRNRN